MVIRMRCLITLPILITRLTPIHTQASDLVSDTMALHTIVAFLTIAVVMATAIVGPTATMEATGAATAIVGAMLDHAALQVVVATVTVLVALPVEGVSAVAADEKCI